MFMNCIAPHKVYIAFGAKTAFEEFPAAGTNKDWSDDAGIEIIVQALGIIYAKETFE